MPDAQSVAPLPGLCRRCGLSKRAAIAGVLCDPPYAGSHDFPKCNCSASSPCKGYGADPARCPVHGESTRVLPPDATQP